jgi:hypothetical protein
MSLPARDAARVLAIGRIAIGAALVAAPRLSGAGWVGLRDLTPGATVFARGLGARDIVLGGLILHTLDREQVGARMVKACAMVDAADAAAGLAVLGDLPPARRWLGLALAAGGAVAGLAVSRTLAPPG